MNVLVVLMALVFSLGACAAGFDPGAEDIAPNATDEGNSEYERHVENMYNRRYCEVLIFEFTDTHAIAKVFNSLELNECPQEQWEALDSAAIKEEHGAELVILNGPRFFLMDDVYGTSTVTASEMETFGQIDMNLAATLEIPLSEMSAGTYIERTVKRTTLFVFQTGTRVYQLLSPLGKTYTMQSYAQLIDPELELAALENLGERLELPDGWSFTTHVRESPLRVESAHNTVSVVQDDLKNTYQRVEP